MEVEREFQLLGIPQMESLLERYQWNEELAGRPLVELATRRDNSPAARNLPDGCTGSISIPGELAPRRR